MLKFVSASAVFAVAMAGQCTDAESKLWIDNPAFTAKMSECAAENMGAGEPTATCLVGAFAGLSAQCASCFGQTVQCGRDNCMNECILDSFAPECLACTESHGCDAGLVSCTGFKTGPPVTPSGTTIAPTGADATTTTAAATTTGSGAVEASFALAALLAVAAL